MAAESLAQTSQRASSTSASALVWHREKVTNVFVFLMLLSISIDMGGEFGIRNVVLPACALAIFVLKGIVLRKEWLFHYTLLVCYPAFLLLLGVAQGFNFSLGLSQFQSTFFAFVLLVLLFKVPYRITAAALAYSILFVALLAVVLAVGLWFGLGPLVDVASLLEEKGGGNFGGRAVGVEAVIPNIYFKSTLFFVPALLFFLFERKYLAALICFLGLVAAVSKTGIAVSIMLAAIFFARSAGFWGRFWGVIVLAAIVFWLVQSPLFILFDEIANNKSHTVDIRAGHFESIIDLWMNDVVGLLFGFGLGSTFYSTGAGGVVSNIELDHLNVVRKYGLVWALLFLLWVLQVTFSAIRNSRTDVRALGWALIISFIVAGTNPVLISPLFFLFLFVTMAANDQTALGRY